MNKQNMKNILKMMIFLCLVITLLHLSSRIVEPKQNTKESGIKYENARGFYGERQNSSILSTIGFPATPELRKFSSSETTDENKGTQGLQDVH